VFEGSRSTFASFLVEALEFPRFKNRHGDGSASTDFGCGARGRDDTRGPMTSGICRTKASILMETQQTTPRMPADYYRREAARVRRLSDEATTPAIKAHLCSVAAEYERLAQRTEANRQLEDERAE
jgi:hypothetical protein